MTTFEKDLDQDVIKLQDIILRMTWLDHRRFAQRLARLNLTMPQYVTLFAIWQMGNNCTMGSLAETTRQVSATMTGIVDRLLRMDLVTRARDTEDRRAVRVSLTDKGTALLEKAHEMHREDMRRVLAHFTPEDRKSLMRLVEQYMQVATSENDGDDVLVEAKAAA